MSGNELALNEEQAASADAPVDGVAGRRTDWWAEARGIFWLVLAVLGFHSFVAKPFYIPSESMLPGLEIGDRLVVTKYPYGYSFVSPTFHILPFIHGRLFGRLPERGDVVIVTPPGSGTDYIKRVIALPGDRIAVHGGIVFLNGAPVPRVRMPDRMVPIDANTQCKDEEYPGLRTQGDDGKPYCRLPIYRETLPNGRAYDTVDRGWSPGDDYAEIRVPKDHVFLMGDNRDNSADSRFSTALNGLGGPVPWENLGGRAEFTTFSLDGSATWNPLTWFGSFRPGRAGLSLHPAREDKPGAAR
ncbi:signal peptidase I [Sphingomonas sp.]|uniref:signal peptidase I n=1 Tax=Sphingomonas sp. TaxID=28214 RepID=UPI001B268E24|nr:signal peptidase I [Sphingomonas sp.]MBO9713015.1 signal peptidase I [Sphingomonas sp.]